jgi:hypothetical protein
MTMKNGKKVATAGQWKVRRAEIIEDFEREVYGRIPKQVPKVLKSPAPSPKTWAAFHRLLKKLVGHVE